jgi:hypothetical protein
MTNKYILSALAMASTLISRVSAVTPAVLPTFDMSRTTAFQALKPWDFQSMLPIIMAVYSDPMGDGGRIIVYGSIFITILVGIAIRGENILIPFTLLAIFGQAMYWGGFIPQTWGIWVVALIFILPAAGIVYALYTSKRKG